MDAIEEVAMSLRVHEGTKVSVRAMRGQQCVARMNGVLQEIQVVDGLQWMVDNEDADSHFVFDTEQAQGIRGGLIVVNVDWGNSPNPALLPGDVFVDPRNEEAAIFIDGIEKGIGRDSDMYVKFRYKGDSHYKTEQFVLDMADVLGLARQEVTS